MTVVHQDPQVNEDLTLYAGSWVAIRDGKVILSALDPIELRNSPDVGEDDFLMPVPDKGSGTFLL